MYFVYIMTNRSKTLYTGVTNNLMRRVREHKTATGSEFTTKYKLDRLVYFERFEDIRNDTAIATTPHAIGATTAWRITSKWTAGVWGGWTTSTAIGQPGSVETTNWMLFSAFPDLFAPGNPSQLNKRLSCKAIHSGQL